MHSTVGYWHSREVVPITTAESNEITKLNSTA